MSATPGPWTVRFSECGGYDCMTDAWWVMSGTRTIADLDLSSYGQPRGNHTFRSPEAEANARLIAAAPDLLSALRIILQTHDVVCKGEDCHIGGIDLARTAIAKAEGR